MERDKLIHDLAVEMGLTYEDEQGISKAFDEMALHPLVKASILRGQLGDYLPGALTMGAKALGVPTSQFCVLVNMGAVTSKDFLPKFYAEMSRTVMLLRGLRSS